MEVWLKIHATIESTEVVLISYTTSFTDLFDFFPKNFPWDHRSRNCHSSFRYEVPVPRYDNIYQKNPNLKILLKISVLISLLYTRWNHFEKLINAKDPTTYRTLLCRNFKQKIAGWQTIHFRLYLNEKYHSISRFCMNRMLLNYLSVGISKSQNEIFEMSGFY